MEADRAARIRRPWDSPLRVAAQVEWPMEAVHQRAVLAAVATGHHTEEVVPERAAQAGRGIRVATHIATMAEAVVEAAPQEPLVITMVTVMEEAA